MNKSEQIKSLCITVEDQSNVINKMTAEIGNYDVQIAEYRQIIQELSNKLKMYESKLSLIHISEPTRPY